MTESIANQGQVAAEESPTTLAAQRAAANVSHSDFHRVRQQLQSSLEGVVENISNDESLPAAERGMQLREAWQRAQNKYSEILTGYREHLEGISLEAEKQVFYIGPSRRDSVRAAYDDLRGRLEMLDAYEEDYQAARDELSRVMDRAELTSDETLSTAAYHLALERGVFPIQDLYLASRPQKRAVYERYARAKTNLDSVEQLMLMPGLIKPSEV
jgi:hypothetical protein